jgi:acyl-CoA synthetase (AMP-forming)/AMP-acid ligase II
MTSNTIVNVGARLSPIAASNPNGMAVVEPLNYDSSGARRYRHCTFAELEADSNRIASGLLARGTPPRSRLVLMVRPSIDFISLVFGLFKAGMTTVLIDPGMGRSNLVQCLEEVDPEGFVAIPQVHAIRMLMRRRFRKARWNVTVGRRWFWGGTTLPKIRATGSPNAFPSATTAGDPAAIIFTTGSTGPPKGVLYSHGNFDRQVDEIRDFYGIQPGGIDLPGFPLFALFNSAMGVTSVIPDMDFTRPAAADPRKIVEAARDWQVTQAFGSPALWNTVGRYCEQHQIHLPSLRCVLSAGAPVPPHVLKRMKQAINVSGDVHTPYGATEALPVASISASEVLGETSSLSREGAGTCVGHRFPGIEWRVIEIRDEPIEDISRARILAPKEIGELIVRGPVVTSRYVTRCEANALHKVRDGETFWHRMGDAGYLDEQDRFWFCGRKSQRLLTTNGPMFTIPCEAIIQRHERVYRAALVGIGPRGQQRPVIIVELWPERRTHSTQDREELLSQLQELARLHTITARIRNFLVHPSLPVDIRHNAKIFREQLAVWAAEKLER